MLRTKTNNTKILPVNVWPEISSPAQSLASVTQVILISSVLSKKWFPTVPPDRFPPTTSTPGVAEGLTTVSGLRHPSQFPQPLIALLLLRQISQERRRHKRIMTTPPKRTMSEDARNTYQRRFWRHAEMVSFAAIDRQVRLAAESAIPLKASACARLLPREVECRGDVEGWKKVARSPNASDWPPLISPIDDVTTVTLTTAMTGGRQ